MPNIISTSPSDIDRMKVHSWLLSDQQAAFGQAPCAFSQLSVSAYISPWLLGNGFNSASIKSTAIGIKDAQIAACFMNQALDFLQRAFCNAIGHHVLARKGLETWSRVTNYYASYFATQSLLCLQGRTITRLHLDNTLQVMVLPLDIKNHVFAVSTRGLGKNPHHETPWRNYYEIYDRYAVSHPAYERVARLSYSPDPCDETKKRNDMNYAPFMGFQEAYHISRQQEFSELFAIYANNLESKASLEELLIDLQGYATDPEYQYFAHVLLKIALAADIILSIRSASPALQTEWQIMHQRWRDLLEKVFLSPTTCYLTNFIPLIGAPSV